MISVIPKASICKIGLYVNASRKTMAAIQKETGCTYILNGGLYNMVTFQPVNHLTVGGKLLSANGNPYGYGINGSKMTFSYANNINAPDFLGAYPVLVRDGKATSAAAPAGLEGYRPRSAVGVTKDGDIVLLCTQSNRSLDGIAGDLVDAGCDTAINLDGGGSSQGIFDGEVLTADRIVHNYLLIWTGETEDETDNDKEEPTVSDQKIVCIDPGHGSTCVNGSPDGTYFEHEFNLDVANRIKAILERHGVKVVMTRTEGTDVSLSQRAVISNQAGADLFLSIHTNASGDGKTWDTPAGWEAFVVTKGYTAEKLAEAIREVTIAATDATDRGVKEANYVVLTNTSAPAVLVEHGFHTNQAEVEKLKDGDYRQLLAQCDARGILSVLGIAYVPGTPADPQKPWYQDACDWVKASGIADGTRPTDPATRAEVFTMLMRLDNQRKGGV